MKSSYQLLVFIFTVQCLKIVTSKPIFKGLSFKKNFEMEISAIPFKHISFIKEKWFPFKMIGVKHDIVKRQVHSKTDKFYSVNEVTFNNEESGKFPELLTSVKHNLDLNSESEVIQNPAPVVETVAEVPVIDPKTIISAGIEKSSVLPINPSIIIAPSIQTAGNFGQTATVVTSQPKSVVTSVPTEVVIEPAIQAPIEATPIIQPLHTHIDVSPIEKLEEGVSKLHTDISSVVPLNALVAPVQETPSENAVKVETPAAEVPKVVEEIKVEPSPVPIVEAPPVVEPPAVIPVLEPTIPALSMGGKTGTPGLLMRGTRFMLYFGSVMLQVLSQMLSGNAPNLNQQLTEPLVLK